MSPAGKITFLDDDHVMRLTWTLLEPANTAGDERIRAFFAPITVDAGELRRLGDGIGASAGMDVGVAGSGHALAGSDVIVFRRGNVTADMIACCPTLRFIQRLGSGANTIDLEAARSRGVGVSCLARRTLAHAAEHAILLMLALAKQLVVADTAIRTGVIKANADDNVAYNWAGLEGLSGLHGRTVGIIGLGEIGSLVAQRARAFGMRVLYSERHRLSSAQESALAVEYRPLPQLLAEADFVTVHADNAAENVKLINREALACMRPTAFLINTSRGRVVDEDALYGALVEGRIAGAGLDVHAVEPRAADDRFCALRNVVLTPHISGGSRLDVLEEIKQMFDNIRLALDGRVPPHGLIVPLG